MTTSRDGGAELRYLPLQSGERLVPQKTRCACPACELPAGSRERRVLDAIMRAWLTGERQGAHGLRIEKRSGDRPKIKAFFERTIIDGNDRNHDG